MGLFKQKLQVNTSILTINRLFKLNLTEQFLTTLSHILYFTKFLFPDFHLTKQQKAKDTLICKTFSVVSIFFVK